MPNLRDHGASQDTEHAGIGWGYEYFIDVSTAWRYAVEDPDGDLGGSMDPSKVGIMGLSMGGFASATAFGLLKDAPGLWLDSAVFRPKEVLQYQMKQAVGSFIAWFSIEPAWIWANYLSGVELDLQLPEHTLLETMDSRPVYIVHAQDDGIVPVSQAKKIQAPVRRPGL